ncbi:MAG: hypothetical protein ABIU38_21345 [Vicinamibacteraceae bacterium]
MPPRAGWLLAGAAASFALVVLHLAVIVVGAPAYAYFLAGEWMVDMAEVHALTPTLITGGIGFVFAVFGVYALAGAGFLELPLTRVLVAAIGCVYTLRGLLIVPETVMVYFLDRPTRSLIFASISLLIGVIHLIGVTRRWAALAPRDTASTPAQ